MPRSACASAGASFTPSPTTATRRPSACSSARRRPSRREHARRRPGRSRPRRRPRRAVRGASPVTITTSSPRSWNASTRRASVGLTVSATTNTARAAPSHPPTTAVRPGRGRVVDRGRELGRDRVERRRATDDDIVAVDRRAHAEPASFDERRRRGQRDAARARHRRRSPRRSGAPTRLRPSPRAAALVDRRCRRRRRPRRPAPCGLR